MYRESLVTKEVTDSKQAQCLGDHFCKEEMSSLLPPQELLTASQLHPTAPGTLWHLPGNPCFGGKGERSESSLACLQNLEHSSHL